METTKSASHPARHAHVSGKPTRQRILEAAEKVFARDGFQGATTREIAREADVNEVTLFRHFQTREHLLGEAILFRPIDVEELAGPETAWKEDLRGELERFVHRYYERLLEREALVRAVVGGGSLLPKAVRDALIEKKIKPLRVALIQRLEAARQCGCIRSDIDPGCAVDVLRDSLHAGMLRHTAYGIEDYTLDTYLKTVVVLFLQGIQKPV